MRRILIIEDNATNRYLARFLLERGGFEVQTAVDGVEGLAMFADQIRGFLASEEGGG